MGFVVILRKEEVLLFYVIIGSAISIGNRQATSAAVPGVFATTKNLDNLPIFIDQDKLGAAVRSACTFFEQLTAMVMQFASMRCILKPRL